METFRVTYSVSVPDYLEAQRHDQALRQGRHALLVSLIGASVIAVLGVIMAVRTPWEAMPYILVILGVFLVLVLGPGFSYAMRRDYRLHPNLQYETTADIEDEGLRTSSQAGDGRLSWGGFQRTAESKNLFLLYSGDRIFYVVPKRAFTPEQHVEFRELLARKIPPKK